MHELTNLRLAPRFLALGFLSLAGSLLLSNTATASAAADLTVTATVTANCTISTTALQFGSYDPIVANLAAPLTGEGTVTSTCASGTAAYITLGQGIQADAGTSDAVPLRRMLHGTVDYLAYFLYSDAARTTVWGNTEVTGKAPVANGLPDVISIYGQIPAGQNMPIGDYTDTVVATVTY
jgi:spore coat protein U-like protein